jgi:activating signal cointegrator complex subunit 1
VSPSGAHTASVITVSLTATNSQTEHAALQNIISSFHTALLSASPAIENVDKGIMIDPIRIHLTLGVMTLKEGSEKTVESALSLLRSLKPQLEELTKEGAVQIPLKRMGVFERGRNKEAGVLWVAPKEDEPNIDVKRLHQISSRCSFRDAYVSKHNKCRLDIHFLQKRRLYHGYERSPGESSRISLLSFVETFSQLHVTIMNTTFRRPRPKFFQGFSLSSILACAEAMKAFNYVPTETLQNEGRESSVDIDLGEWSVSQVQLCIMGSKGPRGEYVSCGGIPLRKT